MEKKAWKWTGKRIALLAAASLIAVFCVWWLRPRSMGSLVGVPAEQVKRAVLEEAFIEEEVDVSGDLEELYGFSFSRPVFCGTLIYQGTGYDLSLAVGDRWQRWMLTDDGALWDGTWCYTLSGGQAARERLAAWLAEQTACSST